MKCLIFTVVALIPLVTRAAEIPTALLIPTSGLQQLRHYLGARPHDEVAGYIALIEHCVEVQLPQDSSVDLRNECQPVVDKLKADVDAITIAVQNQKNEDDEHEKKAVADAIAKAKARAEQ